MKLCGIANCENYAMSNLDVCDTHRREQKKALSKVEKPKRKALPRFSKKRKEENKKYSSDAQQWFLDNPKCKAKLQGCTGDTEHRHHLSGRGIRLNDKEKLLPVCNSCHFLIHNVLSAKDRRSKGLLI